MTALRRTAAHCTQSIHLVQALRFLALAPALAQHTDRREELQLPRLVLVLHGRREERVCCRAEERFGVDFILPGVHGHPPVHHLHRIGAHGCGAKRCEVEAVGL